MQNVRDSWSRKQYLTQRDIEGHSEANALHQGAIVKENTHPMIQGSAAASRVQRLTAQALLSTELPTCHKFPMARIAPKEREASTRRMKKLMTIRGNKKIKVKQKANVIQSLRIYEGKGKN